MRLVPVGEMPVHLFPEKLAGHEAAVACLARSSSKPQSIDSSAACSSATAIERGVCGMVRAASAIM